MKFLSYLALKTVFASFVTTIDQNLLQLSSNACRGPDCVCFRPNSLSSDGTVTTEGSLEEARHGYCRCGAVPMVNSKC